MLRTRVITALVLFFGFGYFLFIGNSQAWAGLMLAVVMVGAWEWAGLARFKSCGFKILFSVILAGVTAGGIYFLPLDMLQMATLVSSFIIFFAVFQFQNTQAQKSIFQSSALVLLMGVLVLGVFAITFYQFKIHFGANLLFLSLMSVWAIDTGAYFAGRRFGKHKLALYVSPGKTWEGVAGGGLLSFLIAVAGLLILKPEMIIPGWQVALLMTFIALLSVFGDLFESLLKRQAGLKDSGNILPGHGGLLDRVDSLLVAIPLFYFFWLGVVQS